MAAVSLVLLEPEGLARQQEAEAQERQDGLLLTPEILNSRALKVTIGGGRYGRILRDGPKNTQIQHSQLLAGTDGI